jgi:hypothetical protein
VRTELVKQVCIDVERLARADIVARHPTWADVEIARELTRRRYGPALAADAYASILPPR